MTNFETTIEQRECLGVVQEDSEVSLVFDVLDVINQDSEDEVPCFHFWIYSKAHNCCVGHLSLRTHTTSEEIFYWGNMGYSVFPEYRGNRFAFKASRLAMEFARQKKMRFLYMTVDPSNIASVKTIINLGGDFIETFDVPENSSLFQEEKCTRNSRYVVNLYAEGRLSQFQSASAC